MVKFLRPPPTTEVMKVVVFAYLIGQNFVGLNFHRSKIFVGPNFSQISKYSSIKADEKLRPTKFSHFFISVKTANFCIFEYKFSLHIFANK